MNSDRRISRVCVSAESPLRDRICAVIRSAGLEALPGDTDLEQTLALASGDERACVVVGAPALDREILMFAEVVTDRLPGANTILVCGRLSDTEVTRAMARGFDGVLRSNELETALAPVIAVVDAGQVSVPRENRTQLRAPALTTREKQVLGMVVMGMSNGEIGRKLYLAESTVKSHLSSAFKKLGVSSRNEAVSVILDPKRGRSLGILSIPAERVPSPA